MGIEQEWFACENDHPVLAGSTICVTCGAQVTDRRVRPPGEPASSSRSPSKADAKPRATVAVAVSTAILVASGVVVLTMVAAQQDPPGPTPPLGPVLTSCKDVDAVEIDLDVPYLDAPLVTCFSVTEETTITIGARGPVGSDLILVIERTDGVLWAGADNSNSGNDPEVVTDFLPGSYVITVSDWYVNPPDSFTLYSVTYDPDDPWTIISSSLPSIAECGSPSVPLLDALGVPSVDATRYSCVVLDSDGFVKFGAITDEGNLADLNLAVHSFNESGRPQFIRSVDNTFGIDPELSVDLPAGTYLIEVGESMGASLGDFSIYVDATGTFFRQGDVSPSLTSLTPSDCTDGTLPTLAFGEARSFSKTKALGCLTLDGPARIVLEAASTANQDLTLEVVGFDEEGSPRRFGWADEYLWAMSPDDVDPRLDVLLPAGVYVISASPYGGGTVDGLTMTVSPAG